MRLLSAGVAGRVALSSPDGPHIIPVNYSVVDDAVVLRTSPYSVLGTHGRDTVLAFEVDQFDYERRHGWSVVARGRADVVTDPAEIAQIRATWEPRPWAGGSRNLYLRLRWVADQRSPDRLPRRPGRDAAGAPGRLTALVHTEPVPGDENSLPTSTRALLEAVTAISSDLDLHSVLERIVRAATELTGRQVRRAGGDRQRRLPRRVRHDRADRGGAGPDRRPAPRPRHPRPPHPPPGADPARRPRQAPAVGRLPAEPSADGLVPGRAGPDPRHRLRQPLPDREGRRAVVHPAGPAPRRGARGHGRLRDRQRPRVRPQRAPPPVAGGVRRAVGGHAATDRGRPGPGARSPGPPGRCRGRCAGGGAARWRTASRSTRSPPTRRRRSDAEHAVGGAHRRRRGPTWTPSPSTPSSATSTRRWCRCARTWSPAGSW